MEGWENGKGLKCWDTVKSVSGKEDGYLVHDNDEESHIELEELGGFSVVEVRVLNEIEINEQKSYFLRRSFRCQIPNHKLSNHKKLCGV